MTAGEIKAIADNSPKLQKALTAACGKGNVNAIQIGRYLGSNADAVSGGLSADGTNAASRSCGRSSRPKTWSGSPSS